MNAMRRFPRVAAYVLFFALAGVFTVKSDEPRRVPAKAVVRVVHGHATCSAEGKSSDLKPDMTLEAGATITTDPDSYVYLNVNGLTSSVRVASETTLVLKNLDQVGSRHAGITETLLMLEVGSLLCHVSKLPDDSKFEVSTPCGVAGIRGTDGSVTVTQIGNGQYEATFQAVQGTMVASAPVASTSQTKTLNSGDAWTVGGEVVQVQKETLRKQKDQIRQMLKMDGPTTLGLGGPQPGQMPAAGAVGPGPRR
jgi:hypothetical protein